MKPRLLYFSLWSALTYAQTVNYTYDNAGRLTRADYDSGTSIVYVYDPAGNLLSRSVTAAPAGSTANRAASSNDKRKKQPPSESGTRKKDRK
jgi:YD repeat-containing protein